MYKGYVKGKEGQRCRIQGKRRNYDAMLEDCIGIPPLRSFVKDKDGVFSKLTKVVPEGGWLFKLFGPIKENKDGSCDCI